MSLTDSGIARNRENIRVLGEIDIAYHEAQAAILRAAAPISEHRARLIDQARWHEGEAAYIRSLLRRAA